MSKKTDSEPLSRAYSSTWSKNGQFDKGCDKGCDEGCDEGFLSPSFWDRLFLSMGA
jgi:hypothetical protein